MLFDINCICRALALARAGWAGRAGSPGRAVTDNPDIYIFYIEILITKIKT